MASVIFEYDGGQVAGSKQCPSDEFMVDYIKESAVRLFGAAYVDKSPTAETAEKFLDLAKGVDSGFEPAAMIQSLNAMIDLFNDKMASSGGCGSSEIEMRAKISEDIEDNELQVDDATEQASRLSLVQIAELLISGKNLEFEKGPLMLVVDGAEREVLTLSKAIEIAEEAGNGKLYFPEDYKYAIEDEEEPEELSSWDPKFGAFVY